MTTNRVRRLTLPEVLVPVGPRTGRWSIIATLTLAPATAWACSNAMIYDTSWTNLVDWWWLAGFVSLLGVVLMRRREMPQRYQLMLIAAVHLLLPLYIWVAHDTYANAIHSPGLAVMFALGLTGCVHQSMLAQTTWQRVLATALALVFLAPAALSGAGAIFGREPPDLKVSGDVGTFADVVKGEDMTF